MQRTPNAPALILAGEGQAPSLSYAELNERSNRLAWQLREQGVGPDVLVGVALGRSLDMPVALLAVLKAGAAYVPLDLSAPSERLRHVLQDSGLKLLLTHSQQRTMLPDLAGIQCLSIDQMKSAAASPQNPDIAVDPANLAYVIYTSGSTGRPKGVAISHGALAEFVTLGADYSNLREGDRVLQFATHSFDGFVEQFYPPLCRGAAVVLRDERLWDSATFHQAVVEHGVTLADLPAAYWLTLVQDFAASPPVHYGVLRQIHVGGEAMAVEGLRLWQQAGLGHVRLLNTYGPTEATVVSSIHDCSALTAEQVSWRGVPIGKALAGRRLYVLDDQLNLLPQGAVGELYIGGPGLARGYHAQPGLSAERFVADPFVPGERLYRTGDRARLRADGAVEYIGRVDHQVKIRGFRIELGEIESRLQQCTGVREAVVLAVELAGSTQLVAYVVPQVMANGDAEQLALRQGIRASCNPACRITWCRRIYCCSRSCHSRPAANWTARHCQRPIQAICRRVIARRTAMWKSASLLFGKKSCTHSRSVWMITFSSWAAIRCLPRKSSPGSKRDWASACRCAPCLKNRCSAISPSKWPR